MDTINVITGAVLKSRINDTYLAIFCQYRIGSVNKQFKVQPLVPNTPNIKLISCNCTSLI
jgi:hypothetical protein